MMPRWRIRLVGVAVAATVAVVAACNSLTSQFDLSCASVPVDWLVSVGRDTIDPADLTVTQGQVVCWESVDGATHPLVSSDGTTLSGTPDQFGPFVDTIMTIGTFAYHCVAHEAAGERGEIVVEPAPPEP